MKSLTKLEAIAIKEIDGKPTMSSLRIAEVTGKEHGDVLKSIDSIFLECEIGQGKFTSTYIDDSNRQTRQYLLPEQEFNLVISGYSAKYRLQLIKELMDYRNKATGSYLITNPIDRAKAWIIEQETLQLETTKRKEAEAKRNLLIHQNKKYTASELAGELGLKSAIKLNRLLKQYKIQYKVNNTWKLYAKYEALGYADYKQVELDSGRIVYQMRWTGIGRDFVISTFNSLLSL